MSQKKIITSALLYANGPLHFGHVAGAYLPGDCYARYCRLQGDDVLYLSGSDEYGIPTTLGAEQAGRTPQEHVDIFHKLNKELFGKLNFSFDHYARTTWPGHIPLVQQYFSELLKNGWIEERVTDHLYSEKDGRFLSDRYVVGTCPRCGFEKARGDECPSCGATFEATELVSPTSKITGAPLTTRPTKHWFLLLDKFKERLREFIASKNWKPNVVKFIQGYIDHMHARAITRDLSWGVPIPLPDTEGKVLYVWFDAPIGYISAAKEWSELQGDPEKWRAFWCDPKTTLVHFIGKDNIPFHATIFPAMTMGQEQPYKLVDELPANEFYHLEGKKFNKSEGWYIDMEDFFTKYTADQIRYTIAANAPETSDSEFTWKDFQAKCNSDLLGKLGNFVNRTLVFAQKHCAGKIPPQGPLEAIDEAFLAKQNALLGEIAAAYSTFQLRKATRLFMELAQEGNVYFDHKAPWKDAKSEETRSRLETTIHLCLLCCQRLALAVAPVIPEAAAKLWTLLGNTSSLEKQRWESVAAMDLPAGQILPQPAVLFQKIEDEQIDAEIAKLQSASKPEEKKHELSFDEFQQLDLRVGEVIAAEPIEKSSKLLYLTVNIGNEERKVVSGIRPHYGPEEMVGKKVVVVANLKPAKLFGKLSQGMILAGSEGKTLEILELQNLPPGAKVS